MKSENAWIVAIGIIILLGGLLFLAMDQSKYAIPIAALTGIGASVLATGITNWLLARHIDKFDVASIIQALTRNSPFFRSAHHLRLIVTLKAGVVTIHGEHSFRLTNTRRKKTRKHFSIYTDLGAKDSCGFEAIQEPTGHILKDNELESCLRLINGKTYFKKTYEIAGNASADFKFYTVARFRASDRLIWTVQDISTNFHVQVINRTGVMNPFELKINHHSEEEILSNVRLIPKDGGTQEELAFDFNAEVLPYQGFELMWNFPKPA